MDIELPGTISAETIERADPAVATLRALRAAGTLPGDLTAEGVDALLDIMAAVTEAALEDSADLSPTEAADRLRIARPSVMRLIARGELSSRKEGGHYVLSPREVRSFQARLASLRREALTELTRMSTEFDF